MVDVNAMGAGHNYSLLQFDSLYSIRHELVLAGAQLAFFCSSFNRPAIHILITD